MTDNDVINSDLQVIYNSPIIDWSKFTDKTILISGANGFLPAYMIEALLFLNKISKKNVKVIALVRNVEKARKRFSNYLENKNLEFIVGDVCNKIINDVKIDYIIHAASQASPKYYGTDPVGTISANVTGTINMLELARQNEVDGFLYFSSAEIYGQMLTDLPIAEDDLGGKLDPTTVRACYAESKRMGENLCVSYSHQYGVKSKIVRPFHTYGPKMDLSDGRVFVDFIADSLAGRDIMMNSDGSAIRAYCYISDAVVAYFKVLLEGNIGEAYNVGNPANQLSVLNLADLIVSLNSSKKVKVIRVANETNYLPSAVKKVVPDISKMNKLGWFPNTSAKEGFLKTLISYTY
jgi:UDP-glucuronate decarboxylase